VKVQPVKILTLSWPLCLGSGEAERCAQLIGQNKKNDAIIGIVPILLKDTGPQYLDGFKTNPKLRQRTFSSGYRARIPEPLLQDSSGRFNGGSEIGGKQ
jgi:hypothetical protein